MLWRPLAADEVIYFADAAHPEHQARPADGWVRRGSNPALRRTSGRGRVNIHGAVNLENFDRPFAEPITADGKSSVQLLAGIEARNPDKRKIHKRKIHVIRDNAPCHRGPDLRAFLAPDCRIRLIQLPPCCPHLNPIERLWAIMHRHVTRNRYYPRQKQFAKAILRFLRETIPKHRRDFRDQATDNFRIISHHNLRVLG